MGLFCCHKKSSNMIFILASMNIINLRFTYLTEIKHALIRNITKYNKCFECGVLRE
uniref:Uncharacterized protein n=1 Tax=Anguilla anguilla TaxID=7936 RepID=A0A0E9QI50_ANGAN